MYRPHAPPSPSPPHLPAPLPHRFCGSTGGAKNPCPCVLTVRALQPPCLHRWHPDRGSQHGWARQVSGPKQALALPASVSPPPHRPPAQAPQGRTWTHGHMDTSPLTIHSDIASWRPVGSARLPVPTKGQAPTHALPSAPPGKEPQRRAHLCVEHGLPLLAPLCNDHRQESASPRGSSTGLGCRGCDRRPLHPARAADSAPQGLVLG